ncbi:MAG: AAA family ATPase [Halanaerobiales bacterium]|nr:AAA family ATPase [Halanaerobiales bacterium]
MKLPYGTLNFIKIRKRNLLYIDKTKYIELLESSYPDYLFLVDHEYLESLSFFPYYNVIMI